MLLEQKLNETVQIKRKEAGVKIFKGLITFMDSMNLELKSFNNVLIESQKDISNRLIRLLNSDVKETETSIPVYKYIRSYVNLDSTDIQL